MFLLSKNNCWADRSIQALFSGYQERLVTFNSMTSQVVQRPRPLTMRICVIGTQRVKSSKELVHVHGSKELYPDQAHFPPLVPPSPRPPIMLLASMYHVFDIYRQACFSVLDLPNNTT